MGKDMINIQLWFKRMFDIILALIGLIIFLPIFIFIGLAIKQEDGGPVLYPGIRVGENGVHFPMFKFRTMVLNADKMGGSSTSDDDPRITKIGKFLRKLKLDELPQLFNVLKGDMSFVGPRPEVPYYVDMFTEEEKEILSVRPGITDWATLWNCDEGALLAGSTDPEKTYLDEIRPEKIRLQLKYVKEQSLGADFIIFLKTVVKLIKR